MPVKHESPTFRRNLNAFSLGLSSHSAVKTEWAENGMGRIWNGQNMEWAEHGMGRTWNGLKIKCAETGMRRKMECAENRMSRK